MIHVVFQSSDVNTLSQAIGLDQSLNGEIMQIRDDFAVGPIENLDTEDGWQIRLDWWQSQITISPYSNDLAGSFDDRKIVQEIKDKLELNPSEILWIWLGQNQHDVCGYFWLISQLKEYQDRVYIIYLNNLPFINEKGHIFYPSALHEIQPKEFLKAKKLNRKITPSEFEVDADEWNKLKTENSLIRILEGGKKITGKGESFYDDDIIKGLSSDWQKGNRAMHNILNKMKIKTGDIFLCWRMIKLAGDNKIEIKGDPAKGWKEFEIRLVAENTVAQALD